MPEMKDSGPHNPSSSTRRYRTGIGYDSHRFAPGGPLVLGGVSIQSDVHLHGHSDADAVAHAVTDAILGACAAGDIGEMFPNTSEENLGRNSMDMLRLAVRRVNQNGGTIVNVDVTVVAEFPKVGPYRADMSASLAQALSIPFDCVSVKGKTNEGMGWIGRGEGIACIAVATVATEAAGA
jgi:2-C-methyl-D-erythritol 2,4-cyclodiphosphate synthase